MTHLMQATSSRTVFGRPNLSSNEISLGRRSAVQSCAIGCSGSEITRVSENTKGFRRRGQCPVHKKRRASSARRCLIHLHSVNLNSPAILLGDGSFHVIVGTTLQPKSLT